MKSSSLYEVPIDSLIINIAIYKWDFNDFIIVDLNISAQKTENVNKEVIIGKYLCNVFPDVKKSSLYNTLKRVHETGKEERFDINLYENNRIKGWRKYEAIKLKNGNIMTIYQDFTKEKELEEILNRVNNFIDNSQTIVFIWSPKNSWPVEYVSNNISDFGYSKDDFLSLKLTSVKIVGSKYLSLISYFPPK